MALIFWVWMFLPQHEYIQNTRNNELHYIKAVLLCADYMVANKAAFHGLYQDHIRPLQWHHNERSGVSNHRRLECLFNRLFRLRSKKTSKLGITVLCEGNPAVPDGFPSQRTSNAENGSIWWRHHAADEFLVSFLQWYAEDYFTVHVCPFRDIKGGRFKNTYVLLKLRAPKSTSFNVWVRYFVWNFKGTIHLKFHTKYSERYHTRFWTPPPPPSEPITSTESLMYVKLQWKPKVVL